MEKTIQVSIRQLVIFTVVLAVFSLPGSWSPAYAFPSLLIGISLTIFYLSLASDHSQ